MADSARRKNNDPEGGAESDLAPFAKPYNDYFEGVQQAHRANLQSASEIYGTYVKTAQAAIEQRDADAFRAAVDEFCTAWSELGKALATQVDRAFDAYHREMINVFASGASSVLGPGCLNMVARSITTVSWHRMLYRV